MHKKQVLITISFLSVREDTVRPMHRFPAKKYNLKVYLHVTFLARVYYHHYFHQKTDGMGLSPILPVISTITIGTILNFSCGNNGHGP